MNPFPVIPDQLTMPDVCRKREVEDLFDLASDAWDRHETKVFVEKLCHAFSLDTHDFSYEVSCDTNTSRAIASIYILQEKGDASDVLHILKMVMASVDTRGICYANDLFFLDRTRNYVIRKETHALPSALELVSRFREGNGSLQSVPTLQYWKVHYFFGTLLHCLGNTTMANLCFQKVKVLASAIPVDNATMTEIERDLSSFVLSPENFCCVCRAGFAVPAVPGRPAHPCRECGISCYCCERCRVADSENQHKEVCHLLVGWMKIVFEKD
jgi:hypothetical protein